MIRASKDKSSPELKKRGKKKSDEKFIKGLSLFDHIKHIKCVQDPNYYKNLSELDKKTFNPFMILKGLSMNPSLVDDISGLYKYFDKIPHAQFYQLLIGLIPPDRKFYPWIKASKKSYSEKLIELISMYYEISSKEAEDCVHLLFSTEKGKKELEDLCCSYGLNKREIEDAMKGNDDND